MSEGAYMETKPRTLPVQCPECPRSLRRLPFMSHATDEYARTCPGCRRSWRIIVKPTAIKGGHMHLLTFFAG